MHRARAAGPRDADERRNKYRRRAHNQSRLADGLKRIEISFADAFSSGDDAQALMPLADNQAPPHRAP